MKGKSPKQETEQELLTRLVDNVEEMVDASGDVGDPRFELATTILFMSIMAPELLDKSGFFTNRLVQERERRQSAQRRPNLIS